jgi:A/G-specific adenine glycosylase
MIFNDELLHWYHQHKRDLPWRNTNDAYVIWLSEIILQQTRVEQGMPYFYRFLEKYPDVQHFAAAHEAEILKLWQGLGYYSRGRNMLKTAQMVTREYGRIFPSNYQQLIKLKGIGAYTAAAIASFSANEARAVVDGNVYRVLARYFGVDEPINSPKGKKIFQTLADDLLNKQSPGLHNQAMMEFGATLCMPKNPACGVCPVNEGCYAFLNDKAASLPVKLKKVKIRERYFNYFLVTDGDQLLMSRRGDKDIWANMYDLPLFETNNMPSVAGLMSSAEAMEYFGHDIKIEETYGIKKHILTHQRLYVRFIKVQTKPLKLKPGWQYTSAADLRYLALPKVVFIFLKNIFNL